MQNLDLQVCIDNGLSKFGADARQRLYGLLSAKCDLNVDQVLSQPPQFVRAIYVVFGESGGRSIERAIIKEIKDRYDLPLSACRDLSTAISSADKLPLIALA